MRPSNSRSHITATSLLFPGSFFERHVPHIPSEKIFILSVFLIPHAQPYKQGRKNTKPKAEPEKNDSFFRQLIHPHRRPYIRIDYRQHQRNNDNPQKEPAGEISQAAGRAPVFLPIFINSFSVSINPNMIIPYPFIFSQSTFHEAVRGFPRRKGSYSPES